MHFFEFWLDSLHRLLRFQRFFGERIKQNLQDNRQDDDGDADITARNNIIKPNQKIKNRLIKDSVEKLNHTPLEAHHNRNCYERLIKTIIIFYPHLELKNFLRENFLTGYSATGRLTANGAYKSILLQKQLFVHHPL